MAVAAREAVAGGSCHSGCLLIIKKGPFIPIAPFSVCGRCIFIFKTF